MNALGTVTRYMLMQWIQLWNQVVVLPGLAVCFGGIFTCEELYAYKLGNKMPRFSVVSGGIAP